MQFTLFQTHSHSDSLTLTHTFPLTLLLTHTHSHPGGAGILKVIIGIELSLSCSRELPGASRSFQKASRELPGGAGIQKEGGAGIQKGAGILKATNWNRIIIPGSLRRFAVGSSWKLLGSSWKLSGSFFWEVARRSKLKLLPIIRYSGSSWKLPGINVRESNFIPGASCSCFPGSSGKVLEAARSTKIKFDSYYYF